MTPMIRTGWPRPTLIPSRMAVFGMDDIPDMPLRAINTALEMIEAGERMKTYMETMYDMDFEVGPGPKYHVYLVPKEKIRQSADVKGTMFVDLGRLRSFKGSQKYPVPAGIDLKRYPSVVIWCEEFGVLISPADLAFR